MSVRAVHRLFPYGVAIAATAVALLLTLLVQPVLNPIISPFFFVAITVTTWYGGLRPGALSILLSTLMINRFLALAPEQPITFAVRDSVLLLSFSLVAMVIQGLSTNLKASKRQVEQLSQKLLADRNDQLQTALQAAQMGLWDWDLTTHTICWSPEHEQLFGLASGTFDGRYQTFDQRIYPDDRDSLNQAIHQSLHDQIPYRHEFRVIWPDGSIHWVEGRGRAFYSTDGQPIRMTGTVMAIDQRKHAEFALKERENLLQLFVQYTPAGIAMFDRHMGYIMASQRWVEQYDLDSIEALIGRSHYEIFPEIPEHWRQVHQRCLAGAIEKCDDDLLVRADGTQQWMSWEIHPWYTATDTIGGIIIFAVDTTQRKQAELALQQLNTELENRVADRTAELTQVNDRLLETLMEQQHTQMLLLEQSQLLELAHDTIMTRDLNAVITYWNQGAERTYGWTKAEALGQDAYSLLKTKLSQPIEDIQATLLERGYWEGEIVHQDRAGHALTVASRWVMQKDEMGRPIKILGINNDITARKQAEQALQQYALEVEDLYNNAPCGYHSLDTTGTIIRMNDTELRWLGYTRNEILGKKKFSDLLTPTSQQLFAHNFAILKQQGQIHDQEFEMVCKNGQSHWFSVNATAIRDADGQFVMSRGTLFDISERHKIDQMKQEFISVVSHELRTPLTSIRGSLGMIAGGVYDRKPEKMRAMIEIAARQSDRLVRLVNDILDLRRLESGQAKFKFTLCAAAELIQQSVDVMRSQAEQSQVAIVILPTQAEVWADADAIVQTFTNLLSNAIKFSPPAATITVSAAPNPSQVAGSSLTRFSIQDQGRGIPADQLETIFGQFQQVDVSDSRDKGGTGLGLAICRTIIEQHQGHIWADSTLGHGSTFYFTLPSAPLFHD